MIPPRKLNFQDVDAVIAEVKRLRGTKCEKAGNWSLEQVCFHLNVAMNNTMRPGPHAPVEVSPELKARLANLLATGQMPGGLKGPEIANPPENVPDGTIDQFLATLEKLKTFKGPYAPHRLFGEISTSEFSKLHLMHSAHHLGHIVPAGQ
jgi:Protein of unknown function (DUF1569)